MVTVTLILRKASKASNKKDSAIKNTFSAIVEDTVFKEDGFRTTVRIKDLRMDFLLDDHCERGEMIQLSIDSERYQHRAGEVNRCRASSSTNWTTTAGKSGTIPAVSFLRDKEKVVIEAKFTKPDFLFNGMVLKKDDTFIEAYYRKKWYNIMEIYDRDDGHLKGWYCNVTRPADHQQVEDSLSGPGPGSAGPLSRFEPIIG